MNQHARYLAIEPSKEMFQLLEHNVEVNQLGERVSTMNAAVGASDGLANIEIDERTGMAQLVSLGGTSTEVVLSISFAGVIEKCGGHVDLMKIDCEGAEYEFFGAARNADLVKCASIVGEYHPAPASIQDSLFEDLARGGFQYKKVVIESTPSGELGLFCAWRD
ncbi:MAG TPA: FkbM family methyltransferase [Acidimicrobiales bacterium]|nr:FkbM family methyltransferase [Acidimicrobiales bacterium]